MEESNVLPPDPRGPLTPYGEALIAAQMPPEEAAKYWKEQYEHSQRGQEGLAMELDRRLHQLADAHATIRTLVKMANSWGSDGLNSL